MRLTRADAALFISVLALAALLVPFTAMAVGSAGAVATLDGVDRPRTIDISVSGDYTVTGALGELKVKVRDGSISVVEAPCPDQVCVSQGRISQTGSVIICAPGRVTIRVGSVSPEVDDVVR